MTITQVEHPAPVPPIHPKALQQVRANVQEVLTASPAYWALPLEERKAMAQAMVRIGSYMVNGESGPGGATATELATQNLPPPPDTAGQKLHGAGGAVAADAGGNALSDEVTAINFPQFVASLIQGTFGAIVTASINQMDAYANLLKNVTKSLDSYMRDNVSENNARDYLAQQYPDHLEVDTSGESALLKPKDDTGNQPLPDFMKDLGLPEPVQSLDPDTVEQTLVPAARQRMALDRQHLLATMVLMGINRLVVTDGDIEAKVLFQLDTKDRVTQTATRSTTFDSTDKRHSESGGFLWFNPTATDDYTANLNVSTTRNESSTAEVNMHTTLSGAVSVHFKSETFPLDKMADIIGVDTIGGQTVGTGRNTGALPAGSGTGPPPLPLPLTPPASTPAAAAH